MPFLQDKLPIALAEVCHSGTSPALWADLLDPIMAASGISTAKRIAAFVGQVGIESAGFSRLEEDLNYSRARLPMVWPSRFGGEGGAVLAGICAGNPEALANAVYCDRMGNGDIDSGDGWMFRGAGLIQLTGRENQTRFANSARISVETVGDFLRTPRGAAQGAAWFWCDRGLNTLADGWFLTSISRHVNGGTEGLQARLDLCNRVLKAIS